MIRAISILAMICCSGCGLAAQRIFAWNTVETKRVQQTHQVEVKSDPSGLDVARIRDGQEQKAGVTPFLDVVTYEVEETRTVHHGWLMASFAAAEFVGGLAMVIFGTQDDGGELDTLRFIGLSLTGGILINLSLIDAIWGGIRLFQKDNVEEGVAGNSRVTYVAKLEGDARSADLTIPQTDVLLTFPRAQVAKSWVIAVMGVEDAAATTEQALSGVLMTNISDQLRTFIAQRVRTIDRGTQEQALIQSIKKESYASCYDEGCQIELGRALAATHIIRGRVTRFGERCILNVALVDLKSEVTVNAASAQGGCQDESFLEMSELAARDLMKQ